MTVLSFPGRTAYTEVTARAHGKINPYLHVGPRRDDGYHDLVTVFQSVSLAETVTVRVLPAGQEDSVTVTGPYAEDGDIPLDARNLALAAVHALAERLDRRVPVALRIDKQVPVAGGMGGGSADAAAALVAYAHLLGGVDAEVLHTVAASLGADVPFALTGGTALGAGRGDELTPVLARGTFRWVMATSTGTLSTPAVFARLDEMRAAGTVPDPTTTPAVAEAGAADTDSTADTEAGVRAVLSALAAGDAHALAAAVHNDMTEAAADLLPDVAEVLGAGRQAGALRALVSGSGPTVGFLVDGPEHALDLAVLLAATRGVRHVVRTTGPASGAEVIDAR
ncbi:4-(cytidine 5'-diphospho)-2-C-methyl-D-erythritol kinase [Brevibacterium litoralis]|uniref:4-(cytidine 5'-diphospho)-2-C-methyl-D-erythritol kinase n=1 Tax=Brevibacterium litoralis TaxID=3138935 RepID=UPI0032F08016